MAVEHSLGVAFGRQVMERAQPNATVGEHLATLRPYIDWGMALAQNLRHLRNIGYSLKDIGGLRVNSSNVLRGVYSRNGWGPPPSELGAGQPEQLPGQDG